MNTIDGLPLIVTQGECTEISLPIEPKSYTRMVAGGWWKEGSAEAKYIEWKRQVREVFDKLDCRSSGMPYQEPLVVSGSFHTKEWLARDLDNLIKGICDCMNPKVRKNGKDLETFAWIDDRQIMVYGQWDKQPSQENWIHVSVSPFWGRVAPWIPYTQGILTKGGEYVLSQSMGYLAQFPVATAAPWSSENHPREITLFLWPTVIDGRYLAFPHIEQWLLYREACRIKGVGASAFFEVCKAHDWPDMALALEQDRPAGWQCEKVKGAKLERLFKTLRAAMPSPLVTLKMHQTLFDQATFEECAKQVSMAFGEPWPQVRAYLQSIDVPWAHTSPEEMISKVAQLMPSWAVPKQKKTKGKKGSK